MANRTTSPGKVWRGREQLERMKIMSSEPAGAERLRVESPRISLLGLSVKNVEFLVADPRIALVASVPDILSCPM